MVQTSRASAPLDHQSAVVEVLEIKPRFPAYVFPRRRFYVFTRIPNSASCYQGGPAMMQILIADDEARMRQMAKPIVAGLASGVYEVCDWGH